MSSDFDPADFVDDDFQARKTSAATATAGFGAPLRAPSREEVDSKVVEAQQKLAELKRAQEELERERASLEETRRRQMEFQTGRQEMIHNLTRGLGLLEEAEFTARRDAEQMAKTLADFREALGKIETIREETWTKDNFNVELTRALTAIENARMEWNAARLKFTVLSGQKENGSAAQPALAPQPSPFVPRSFGELCKFGLALTWPLVLVALGALGVLIAILLRR
jgi:predicted nuclease with TOPRIM domain